MSTLGASDASAKYKKFASIHDRYPGVPVGLELLDRIKRDFLVAGCDEGNCGLDCGSGIMRLGRSWALALSSGLEMLSEPWALMTDRQSAKLRTFFVCPGNYAGPLSSGCLDVLQVPLG